jgi:hypothetical protein
MSLGWPKGRDNAILYLRWYRSNHLSKDDSARPKELLRRAKTSRKLPSEDILVSPKEYLGQAKTVHTVLK